MKPPIPLPNAMEIVNSTSNDVSDFHGKFTENPTKERMQIVISTKKTVNPK